MNGVVKSGLVIVFVSALAYAISRVQKSVDDFSIRVQKIGIPRISKSVVTLPIDLQFDNTTGIPISINDFVADLYVKKNGQWVKGGVIQQPVQLPTGVSVKRIEPSIDLGKIFGSNIFATIDAILNTIDTKSIIIKAEANGTANGVPLRNYPILPEKTINL